MPDGRAESPHQEFKVRIWEIADSLLHRINEAQAQPGELTPDAVNNIAVFVRGPLRSLASELQKYADLPRPQGEYDREIDRVIRQFVAQSSDFLTPLVAWSHPSVPPDMLQELGGMRPEVETLRRGFWEATRANRIAKEKTETARAIAALSKLADQSEAPEATPNPTPAEVEDAARTDTPASEVESKRKSNRKSTTTIERDLEWYREFKSLPGNPTITYFADTKNETRPTMSQAFSRAKAHLEKEAKQKPPKVKTPSRA